MISAGSPRPHARHLKSMTRTTVLNLYLKFNVWGDPETFRITSWQRSCILVRRMIGHYDNLCFLIVDSASHQQRITIFVPTTFTAGSECDDNIQHSQQNRNVHLHHSQQNRNVHTHNTLVNAGPHVQSVSNVLPWRRFYNKLQRPCWCYYHP